MANYEERRIIYEINQAMQVINPLNGLGGATQTAAQVASSWIDHSGLHKKTKLMMHYLQQMMIYPEDKEYFIEEIDKLIESFWRENENKFKDTEKRKKYEDYIGG